MHTSNGPCLQCADALRVLHVPSCQVICIQTLDLILRPVQVLPR